MQHITIIRITNMYDNVTRTQINAIVMNKSVTLSYPRGEKGSRLTQPNSILHSVSTYSRGSYRAVQFPEVKFKSSMRAKRSERVKLD